VKPLFANYYLTRRCNARCRFCDIWKTPGGGSEPKLEEIGVNLDHLKRLGVKIVDFTGGEPLLYPHLAGALRLAKDKKLFTTVTTNAILYPDRAAALQGLVDVLQFSLESVDEARHDEIRGVPCYDKVMQSIDIAARLGQPFSLIKTVVDEDEDELRRLVRFAQERNILLVFNPGFSYFGNSPISRKAVLALRHLWKEKCVAVDLAHLAFILKGGNKTATPLCRALSTTVVISPENRLLLPCFHRAVKELPIGGDLFHLYHSPSTANIREKEGRFPFCEGCTIYCSMRGVLYRPTLFSWYGLPAFVSGAKYVWERYRSRQKRMR